MGRASVRRVARSPHASAHTSPARMRTRSQTARTSKAPKTTPPKTTPPKTPKTPAPKTPAAHECSMHRRGTDAYRRAKTRLLRLMRTKRGKELMRSVPADYVKVEFEEQEDRIDFVCLLESGTRRDIVGFALLTKKLMTSWVPPGWTWRYLSTTEQKRIGRETVYTHAETGRTVYDDLDEVWKGRDESEPSIFKVRTLHIQLLCGPGHGATLMRRIEQLATDLGLDALTLGAANDDLQKHYAKRYGFDDDRVGCKERSTKSRALIDEWNRAHKESDGFYGEFMSKCLTPTSTARKRDDRRPR